MHIFAFLGLFFLLAGSVPAGLTEASPIKLPLSGKVIVIDPGHGGKDPGASGFFEAKQVFENEYVYDVALRIEQEVRKLGGLSFFTIRKTNKAADKPRNIHPTQILERDMSEVFSLDKTIVQAGILGLPKRTNFGNAILEKYPRHKVFYVAIHFDKLGENTEIQGVRIITPDEKLLLAQKLKEAFDTEHRLREQNPVVKSGDHSHGIRNLYILRSDVNRIEQRVLIELGNFNNSIDVWRIRTPEVRAKYAEAIVTALKKFGY